MYNIKAKQLGNNIVIVRDTQKPFTIVVPKNYNFDRFFSLCHKNNSGIKIANVMLEKEIAKFIKAPEKNKEVLDKRIEKRKIEKKIKEIQGFDYSKYPIFVPEDWRQLIDSTEDNQYLINFLMWLSLCDNEYTRNNFLKSFDSKYCYITPNGFIASLRQVWKKESNDELYDFIQSSWLKVKTSWKKKPVDFIIISKTSDDKIKNYFLVKEYDESQINHELVGNLDELKNTYTSSKKTTYESDYGKRVKSIHQEEWSVGDVVTMPDKATHGKICGVRQYHILQDPLDVIDEKHGKYGDTIALVLVNPAHVISIEAGWKYTTSSWYFASVMDKTDVKEQFNSQWGVFDHDYLEKNIEEIKASIIESKESNFKLDKKVKINNLKEELKPFKMLNNKTEHLTPVLYNEILSNRIALLK